MGISGLLPLLKSIHRQRHIREWAGKTVGVDAYGWLHRGTISCAVDLALGKQTTRYVDYAMCRVRMLRHFGVTPYLIFDGDYLPSKAATEAERTRKRRQSKQAGLELLRMGRSTQAYAELQKAVDVTPTMARHLIDACKSLGIQCIVAPYEADAQMYYLEKMGIIDAIISEDSDLLVFGAKCLLTKLDQFGECVEINRSDFGACREVSLAGWSDAEFRSMCILSGCDYLANIPRLGLKTAYRLVRRHKQVDKILNALKFGGNSVVPEGYSEAFVRAELTFLHQRVFCPIKNCLVMCNEPETPLGDELLAYIGAETELELARSVACGDLDPITKRPIVTASSVRSTTSTQATADSRKRKLALCSPSPAEVNTITSFFKPVQHLRTPLQARSINIQPSSAPANSNPFSTASASASTSTLRPAPTPSTSLKRPLPWASSAPKRPRLDPPPPNAVVTGKLSAFFETPSRRQSRGKPLAPHSAPEVTTKCAPSGPTETARNEEEVKEVEEVDFVPESPPMGSRELETPSRPARQTSLSNATRADKADVSPELKSRDTESVSSDPSSSSSSASTIAPPSSLSAPPDTSSQSASFSSESLSRVTQGWKRAYSTISSSSTPSSTPTSSSSSSSSSSSTTTTASTSTLAQIIQKHRLQAPSSFSIPSSLSSSISRSRPLSSSLQRSFHQDSRPGWSAGTGARVNGFRPPLARPALPRPALPRPALPRPGQIPHTVRRNSTQSQNQSQSQSQSQGNNTAGQEAEEETQTQTETQESGAGVGLGAVSGRESALASVVSGLRYVPGR